MAETAPRRIALVGHRLAELAPTGIGRYYTEIARGLAELADPATHHYVVASTREGRSPAWVPPALELRTLGGPRKARALAWGLLERPSVDGALGHPDLVHLLQTWAPLPTSAPLVATVHDLLPMLQPQWHGRMESWSFRRSVAQVAERAALIIVPSAHTAAVVTEHLAVAPDRLRVVPMAVGDEFRRRPTPEEVTTTCAHHGVEPGRYLLTIGTVSERKNLSVVLRGLAGTDPALLGDPALLVAGPLGRGFAAIEAEAARLGLVDRIRFAGFVPDAELPVLLAASLALVHPSRDEGFGMTPLEAMASGVPALASAAGSVPEVAGAAAVLLDPEDPDAWAAAITEVAADPERRFALVAAGLRHEAAFTWRRTAAATLAVHDEVLR